MPHDLDRTDLIALEHALVDAASLLIGLAWDPDERDEYGSLGPGDDELRRAVAALSAASARLDDILPRLHAHLEAGAGADGSGGTAPSHKG